MATRKVSQPRRPATGEGVLLWVIHRFAEKFSEHAVLKGGMALRLLDSARHTNDVDYVFVPFESKKSIFPAIEQVLHELDDATVQITQHSTIMRADIRLDNTAVQVEISVSQSCDSIPIATANLAHAHGIPSQIVRIMAPDVALAHKLAAWNERRLSRDLYDAYFLSARAQARPNLSILQMRLVKVQSRIPKLRKRTHMTLDDFVADLESALLGLTDASLSQDLQGLVDSTELVGLALRIQVALRKMTDRLTTP